MQTPADTQEPIPTETPAPDAPAAVAKKPSLADRISAFRTANAGSSDIAAQLAAEQSRSTSLTASLTVMQKERDDLRAEMVQIEAALSAKTNAVKATAAEIAASVGIPAAQLPAPEAQSESPKEMKRAAFAALSPSAQAKFCKQGGVVIE